MSAQRLAEMSAAEVEEAIKHARAAGVPVSTILNLLSGAKDLKAWAKAIPKGHIPKGHCDPAFYDDTLKPAKPTEREIIAARLSYGQGATREEQYPQGGDCSTGRCNSCGWCDFMRAFTPERVLELLDADLAGFLERHGESIAANLEAILPDWRGTPEGLTGVKAALAEIEDRNKP